jgi:predicted secreted protein
MKRCPKCEFIYEDDQSLCDMDGVLLVLDSRKLPNHEALQTVPAVKTAPKRNRAVPAFATVILALVLGLVYYVSVHRKATQNSYTPPAPSAASTTTNPVPAEVTVNPTPEAQPPASEEPKPEPARSTAPTAASATAPAPVKKVAAKPAPTPAKPKIEEKKDESKINSILKKTGRILKKPFKF